MTRTRSEQLAEQIEWHWTRQLRDRLSSLSDAEYFWEPVDGCWSVRHRGTGTAAISAGSGDFTVDFEYPEPEPAPVTTISWRLAHILVGVLGARLHSHFGAEPASYESYDYPGTAAAALERLENLLQQWFEAVKSLDGAALDRAVGPAEGPFADRPMIDLVLHVNRELIHHLAEVALLRDLYARRKS